MELWGQGQGHRARLRAIGLGVGQQVQGQSQRARDRTIRLEVGPQVKGQGRKAWGRAIGLGQGYRARSRVVRLGIELQCQGQDSRVRDRAILLDVGSSGAESHPAPVSAVWTYTSIQKKVPFRPKIRKGRFTNLFKSRCEYHIQFSQKNLIQNSAALNGLTGCIRQRKLDIAIYIVRVTTHCQRTIFFGGSDYTFRADCKRWEWEIYEAWQGPPFLPSSVWGYGTGGHPIHIGLYHASFTSPLYQFVGWQLGVYLVGSSSVLCRLLM